MHINKTAGKSIEKWFAINNNPIVGAEQDLCQNIITQFNPSGFYFTVVRNPYSRIVSQFLHWRDNLKRLQPEVSFDFYIKNLSTPVSFVKREYVHMYQHRFHMPCSYWIRSDKFKIFKFEELNSLKDFFIKSFGLEDNLPHINTTQKVDPMSYFSSDTLTIVNQLMDPDFENFNYIKKLP